MILKASSGIDYSEFFTFIRTIAARRLKFLGSPTRDEVSSCNKTDISLHEQTSNAKTQASPQTPPSDTGTESADCKTFQFAKVSSQPYHLSRNHAVFDLRQIKLVLSDMIQDDCFNDLDWSQLLCKPDDFLEDIRGAISDKTS